MFLLCPPALLEWSRFGTCRRCCKIEWEAFGSHYLNFYRSCLESFCCTETEAGEGVDCSKVAVLGSAKRIPVAQQLHRLPFAAGQVADVSAVRKSYKAGNRNGRIKD